MIQSRPCSIELSWPRPDTLLISISEHTPRHLGILLSGLALLCLLALIPVLSSLFPRLPATQILLLAPFLIVLGLSWHKLSHPDTLYCHRFTFDIPDQAVLFDEQPLARFAELRQVCLQQQCDYDGQPLARFALKLEYRSDPYTVICCNGDRPALRRAGQAIARVTGLPLVEQTPAGNLADTSVYVDSSAPGDDDSRPAQASDATPGRDTDGGD